MYTKVCDLLDIFVKMSGEKYNINELVEEAKELEESIPELNEEIKNLKLSMTDDKYFDASSEIIDRNIELSLKKKLLYLQNELKKLNDKNKKNLEERETDDANYEQLHANIEHCEQFINELTKADNGKGSKNIAKLIEMESDRYNKLVEELNSKIAKKEEDSSSANDINDKINALQKKINIEEERLIDVRKSLEEKKSYVNEEAKELDIERLNDLNKRYDDLTSRRSEILNSITYQCELIKDCVLNNYSKEDILDQIHDVANRLNELPYLNVEDEAILKEEINQLNSKKDELTAVIENKKYNLKNSKPFDLRFEYLEKKISSANKLKDEYQKLLDILTKEELDSAVENLVRLREERQNLDNAFSNVKKTEEQKIQIDNLIRCYEDDLSVLLNKSKGLQEDISYQEEEIKKSEDEIKDLNHDKREQFEIENRFEKERDSKMLEDTLKNLDYVSSRLEIKLTPNQVLDQIEMLLFENDDKKPSDSKEKIIKNYKNNKGYTFEKVESNEKGTETNEKMVVSEDSFVKDTGEEQKDFTFSPIDNTGYVSFDEAYNSTK